MSDENNINKKQKIRTPANELDLNVRLIEPAWGRDEVPQNFQERLTQDLYVYDREGNLLYDSAGNPITKKNALWESLGFITKDFREGNLSRGNIWKGEPNEVFYCEYWAQLASDFIQDGYFECAIICISMVALKLELTQSAGGFFSRNVNTLRQETTHESREITPRKFFGGSKPVNN